MRVVTEDTYPVHKPMHVLPDPITFMDVPVAVDTETSGLFVDDGARVCVVSVAYRLDPDTIEYWAFPFDQGRAEDKGFHTVYYSDKAKKALRGKPKGDPDGRWSWDDDHVNLDRKQWDFLLDWLDEAGQIHGLTGQNIGFDTHMLRAGTRQFPGIDLDRHVIWDTMLASARLWPSERTTSLKPTAARLYGQDEVAEAAEVVECLAEVKKRYGLTASDGPRYDLMPWDVNGPYAAQDAALTLRLTEDQIDLVEEGMANGTDVYRDLLLGRVLHNIERRGLGPYRVQESLQVAGQVNERLMTLSGRLPFSPPTPAKARAHFFENLGAKPWGPGEKAHTLVGGKIIQQGSLTVHTADRMAAAGVPAASDYAEYLRLSTANRMFYRNYADLAGEDGRLRTSFRQAYVKSGRMSVQRFQAQALPKHLGAKMDGQPLPEPRSLFDVDPGRVRVNLDLNQAELRIAAKLAECEPMVQTLSQFGDVHGMVCKQVFGVEPDDPDWKAYRDIAKRPIHVDTPVPTPAGVVRAGDVRPGDQIYGRTGQPTTVTHVHPQGVIPLWRVTTGDGRTVDAGADHLWTVTHTVNQPTKAEKSLGMVRRTKTMTTLELVDELDREEARGIHGFTNLPMVQSAPDRPDVDFPVDPYLLGAWLGNGLRHPRPGIALACHTDDVDFWTDQFPVYRVAQASENGSVVWIKAEDVGASTYDLEKADPYRVLHQGSAQQRRDLLAGLLDTDGSPNRHDRTFTFAQSKDIRLPGLVQSLIWSLGGWAKISSYQPSVSNSRRAYEVNGTLSECPFRMPRKARVWRPMQRVQLPVTSVKPAPPGEAVCFTVDAPDHLFLCGDYVSTHNCNFGAVFGIGPRTFQVTVFDGTGEVMNLAEIKGILDAYRDSYPEFAREYSRWEQFVTLNGYVPLVRGVSHFRSDDWPRTGWSRRVQGSLALFVREWLIAIEDLTSDDEALVGTVHDSVVLDLPTETAEATVKAIGMVTSSLWEDMFGLPGGCEPSDWVTGQDWEPPSG